MSSFEKQANEWDWRENVEGEPAALPERERRENRNEMKEKIGINFDSTVSKRVHGGYQEAMASPLDPGGKALLYVFDMLLTSISEAAIPEIFRLSPSS